MEAFSASVPADSALLFEFRQSLRTWLRTQVGPDTQDALMLAVHEAVANGVEHGNGSRVLVDARVDDRGLVIEISTEGSWEPESRQSDPLDERGRGLALMRGLTDELELLVDEDGVSIRLRPSHTRRDR